jgi:hypothetical protein
VKQHVHLLDTFFLYLHEGYPLAPMQALAGLPGFEAQHRKVHTPVAVCAQAAAIMGETTQSEGSTKLKTSGKSA